VDRSVNLAIGATVDSPDGLEQDWCIGHREGCRDSWAADGILDTYWDEMDQQEVYRLKLRLAPEHALIDVAALAITAFSHYRFAPRTWVIFCDNRSVAEVTDAVYEDNRCCALAYVLRGILLALREIVNMQSAILTEARITEARIILGGRRISRRASAQN